MKSKKKRRLEVAKRFVDPDIWKKAWYRRLEPKMKCVWHYMTENCDISGILELDIDLMSFQIGENISKTEIDNCFKTKIVAIELGKIFIPSFVEFQQNCPINELNNLNNCHKGIINKLKKYAITRAYLGADKPLIRAPGNSNSNSNSKSNNKRGSGGKNIFDLWNEHSQELPKANALSDKRKKAADSRWSEKPDLKYWQQVIQKIAASSFCNGGNDRGWKADFDFLVRPDTHLKAMEGKYDNKQSNKPKELDPFEKAALRIRGEL